MFAEPQHKNNAQQQSPVTIQPKLEIGAKDDVHEKEADAIAGKVMRMPEKNSGDENPNSKAQLNFTPGPKANVPSLHLKKEEEEKVHMKTEDVPAIKAHFSNGNGVRLKSDAQTIRRNADTNSGGPMAAPANVESGIAQSKGGGQSLPENVQKDIGGKMGADLSEVKIHTDSNAHNMSSDINAKAFTHGSDIYFKQGNYNTTSDSGKELLTHELVHTQQQKGGVQRKVQRSFWGDVWGGIKKVGNVIYDESGIKSIVDTGKDIYHYYADSPQQFQKYMQSKLKGQIDELHAAKNPTAKFYVAYYAMKGIAIAMNPLALFMMPSVDSLWSIYVQGKLGYYTYLFNLGNKYIEKENAQTGKMETVQNQNYKDGGYTAVFGNQMKNMLNPMFLWGELKGIFKGIGNWFVDLWEMIKFLGKMFWGGITDTWNLLVHQKPPSWMDSIAKSASSAGNWFNTNGKAVMKELGVLLGDPEKLKATVKDLKAALKTGAQGLAYTAGEGIAGVQVKVMSMSAEEQGEMFGKVIGYLIPEIVIAVFSETIVNWLKSGVKALQVFWKTVQASRAMAKIFEGARWVVQMFEKLGLMFKRIGGTMGRMFDEVMEFFRGIFKWGEEAPKERNLDLLENALGGTTGKAKATWIKHDVWNDLEKLGLQDKFKAAMDKGFAPRRMGEGSSGMIRLLGDEIIENGGNLYNYKLKILGKGVSHYRLYGRLDENGAIIFDLLLNK
jgi:hypothetical protein